MSSLPPPAPNQPYVNVSALEAGIVSLDYHMYIENTTPNDRHPVPALSFLLQHTVNGKKFILDLGVRKDWENSPPKIVEWMKSTYMVEIKQDAVESLVKGGIAPTDIDTVCLTHIHFDHTGDTTPYTNAEFVVGEDTKKLLANGLWPYNKDGFFPADLLPTARTRFLGDDVEWKPIGPFPRAYDFYGDGSLYIVDAPGHLSGHINVLARTSSDGGWIYLAGDTAHHWNLLTGKSAIPCGHPGHLGDCAHENKALAEDTLRRVIEMTKLPRVRVLLAHDRPWYEENKNGPAYFPGKLESL